MPGKIVSKEEWLAARKELLVKEKESTRAVAALHAELRSFPMTEVTKTYTLNGPAGPTTLAQLFGNHKQLIIYHFMLPPSPETACRGCSFLVDNLPSTLSHLNSRNTTLALVSRAPLPQILAFKERMGWDFPWYSSYESDFNYDFGTTLDKDVRFPVQYNFVDVKETRKGDMPGLSVFYREGDGKSEEPIYHSYSSYARGLDRLLGTYTLLDMTPLGRQDKGDDASPVDWKYHDEYENNIEKDVEV
ncbi:CalU12 protein [Tricladium varicosporioides]|nr:CalU12 protein [Hymenoscyphus varicosporioides]